MSARAIWTGILHLGDARIPLALHAAVEDRSLDFRLVDPEDRTPVEQRMVNPETGAEVAWSEARRARKTASGGRVVLDEEELDELGPEPDDRTIEVVAFLEPGAIEHVWYERAYLLSPDDDDAVGDWRALTRALERTGLEGLVRWTMRDRWYRGALRLHRGTPVLVALRSAAEVADLSGAGAPEGEEPTDREREMAEELVERMSGPFEPEEWERNWRERVLEVVEAKAEGRTVELGEYRRRRDEGASLEEALQASLEEEDRRRA